MANSLGRNLILIVACIVVWSLALWGIPTVKARMNEPHLQAPQAASAWPAQLDETMRHTEGMVDAWLDSLKVSPLPSFYHVLSGQKVCGGRLVKSDEAFYCRKEMTVYIPPEMVNASQGNPAFFNAWLVGHEVTHHLQDLGKANQTEPQDEQQADCGAGVFVKWAIDNQLLSADDSDANYWAYAMYQSPGDKVHGSGPDSSAAFQIGYEGGSLKSCIPLEGPLAGV